MDKLIIDGQAQNNVIPALCGHNAGQHSMYHPMRNIRPFLSVFLSRLTLSLFSLYLLRRSIKFTEVKYIPGLASRHIIVINLSFVFPLFFSF